jgi:hypothetical protein
MASPTESAEVYFRASYNRANEAAFRIPESDRDPIGLALYDTAATLSGISQGLGHLAVGLRATYMLLERVEKKLDQQRIPGR